MLSCRGTFIVKYLKRRGAAQTRRKGASEPVVLSIADGVYSVDRMESP